MSKKKDEVVTRTMLDEAVEAILQGVGAIVEQSEKRLDIKMDTNQKHTKDSIDGLKAEFSDTPSRHEFEDLRSRVQKLEKVQIN